MRNYQLSISSFMNVSIKPCHVSDMIINHGLFNVFSVIHLFQTATETNNRKKLVATTVSESTFHYHIYTLIHVVLLTVG